MLRTVAVLCLGLYLSAPATAQIVNKLYLPQGAGNLATTVFGLDSKEVINQIAGNFEIGLAVTNSDSSEVWLFGDHSTYCNIINSTNDRLIRTFDAGITAAKAVFSPDGKYCFAIGQTADKPGQSLMAIDCGTHEALYAIGGFSEPAAAAVSADSKFLYVAARTDGVVAKVAIPSFQVVKLIAVGPEPVDLQLSSDGRFLYVACQGLERGKRGGSQIVIVDIVTDKLTWIANDIGRSPQSLSLNANASRLVVTYAEPQLRPQANVRVFHIEQVNGEFAFTPGGGFLHGVAPAGGVLLDQSMLWIGADEQAGMAWLDLVEEGTKSIPDILAGARPKGVAVVRLDVGARIADFQANMATSSDTTQIADSYLDLAYLQNTAGNKNEVVAAYNKVISSYPTSLAAISAGLRMSEIAHSQDLVAQSAEYGFTALQSYADFLSSSSDKRVPQQTELLAALDRVAAYSTQAKKDYLKQLAERLLKVSAQNSTLAELFFSLGFQLQLQEETKLAKRCFLESRNQIGAIQDRMAMLSLSARLALVGGEAEALYRLRDRKEPVAFDGQMTEWQKAKALSLSGDGGYVYGSALWSGVNDLSASLYFATTKTDLLIAGTVLDNSLVSFSDGKGDGIRFYLDFRPESASLFTRSSSLGDGCFEIAIDAPTASIPKARLKLSSQAEYEIGSESSASGYSFEVRIPLTAFGRWYNSNTKRFGLGVEILDFDAADNVALVKALGFLLPTHEPGAAPDPMLFGIADR